MLSHRIFSTIKFFDLQDLPLTSFEIERYLISDKSRLEGMLNEQFELGGQESHSPSLVSSEDLLSELEIMADSHEIAELNGFYCLPNREVIIAKRLRNYKYGLLRERRIRRYVRGARHIPFVRGIALAGSQAMGMQRSGSDIDLLVITDPEHMWTARVFLTIYFQILGMRRHGKKIANRFCLNHYLSSIRELDRQRNLYTAMEYAKLRPLVYGPVMRAFQQANLSWINTFFPNVAVKEDNDDYQSEIQRFLEAIIRPLAGKWLENLLASLQRGRIKEDKLVFVKEDELSFHPAGKHEHLLQEFFA